MPTIVRLARRSTPRHCAGPTARSVRKLRARSSESSHHERRPIGLASRREAFQISPQLPQRQYVLSSGVLAVVEIDADRHAGQEEGIAPAALDDGRPAAPLPISYEFTCAPKNCRRLSARQRVNDHRDNEDDNGRSERPSQRLW